MDGLYFSKNYNPRWRPSLASARIYKDEIEAYKSIEKIGLSSKASVKRINIELSFTDVDVSPKITSERVDEIELKISNYFKEIKRLRDSSPEKYIDIV